MNRRPGPTALFTLLLLALCGRATVQAQNAGENSTPVAKADILFVHANVYTGVPANTAFRSVAREEAIAVRGDRIQAVGKTADMDKVKGPETKVIDLGGHFVMPGFNDAHVHLDDAGSTKLSLCLLYTSPSPRD